MIAHADREPVVAEDAGLERREERQLAGQPRDRQERRQRRQKGDVSDHWLPLLERLVHAEVRDLQDRAD